MANSYEEVISQIKDRLDIVEVVSRVVILKKSGANYWGLCPFHNDKKPSLSVNPQKGIYKCFSCGAGGDALTFIMKTQNKEFKEVVRELAEQFGIELPKNLASSESSPSAHKKTKDEMIKACTAASKFFTKQLTLAPDCDKAKTHLAKRGINDDVIKKFSLGWATNDYTALYNHLKKDFSDDILEQAGLIIKGNNGKWIDRFRNRIIIPIQDIDGKYIAFGARAVDEGQSPKYLNSSDSLIYNKSKILYGIYTAKEAISKEDGVVIMEGYFDVISAQANGVENCVASCGTSLTSSHVKLLSSYTKSRRIYLSFDTDSAGIKATKRGGEIIKEAFAGIGEIKNYDDSHLAISSNNNYSCEIRVISPPEGKDPDEYIRANGAEGFKKFINNAQLLIDFELGMILKQKADTPQEKAKLAEEIIPILAEINNSIIRSEYIKNVADTLKIDEGSLSQEVDKLRTTGEYQRITPNINVTKTSQIQEKTQKNLLSVYFTDEGYLPLQEISQMIDSDLFTDQSLIIVKNTIDKLVQTVNNVRELTDRLYTEFISDEHKSQIITDLIYMSEAFNGLTQEDFKFAITESVDRLKRFKQENELEELRKEYKNVNDNDIEALKMQIQLREKMKDWR